MPLLNQLIKNCLVFINNIMFIPNNTILLRKIVFVNQCPTC